MWSVFYFRYFLMSGCEHLTSMPTFAPMSNLYSQRGVSAQKEDVHEAIKNLDKGLFPNAFCKILPDYVSQDDDYCCIMHADTAGTKSIIAYLYWKRR
ncbi:hypothetical protein EMGBS15_15180 [Filimonas sp.]|nr:hypothetical protein EMGBS15_15180 [Filimonas sp.]